MNAKQRAVEIFNQHIALASIDGRKFRKTVMDQLMSESGCTQAAAATHYNSAKKGTAPIKGLGRAVLADSVRKTSTSSKGRTHLQDDNECFTIIELEDGNVARCRSFLTQGDASESFDEKMMHNPRNDWVMIQGLGPISGEEFKLRAGEKIIKQYSIHKDAEFA